MNSARKIEYDNIVKDSSGEFLVKKHPFLGVIDCTKDFDLGDYLIRAVDHISLEIAEHEYLAIIGVSGAGKTTLMHLLAGLDKSTEGKVFLSHIDLTPMEEETLATFRIFNVGLIFQNYNLISSLTALENIMFPMQLCGTEPAICESRANELLELVGLSERENHLPFQLSAGEQQRVAIARALANDPPIIIADEPTANLDKKNSEFIGDMFEKFQKEGKTIVVATHDENLYQYAHRILEMDDGKIISDKKIKEIAYIEENEDLLEDEE